MNENPYKAPQADLDQVPATQRAVIFPTIRATVAEFGLVLAVLLLLVLQIATIVPGSEKGLSQKVAMLGCACLVHPNKILFVLGLISLLVYLALLL
jgi:hypothetical protein